MGAWMRVGNWINGLFGAFIGASAGSIGTAVVDPHDFNPMVSGNWKRLAMVALINGIVGAALYLKNAPTPWDGMDRRNGGITA